MNPLNSDGFSCLFRSLCVFGFIHAVLFCDDRSSGIEKVNMPLRISFRCIDQFGMPASGIKASVSWCPMVGVRARNGSIVYTSDPQRPKSLMLTADQRGNIIYEGGEPCPGGQVVIMDSNYMSGHEFFPFALTDYFKGRIYDYFDVKDVHVFNKESPEIIHVWRRIGYQPLVIYKSQSYLWNEVELVSATGEVRFDLTTFQPVDDGGDIIVTWEIGDAVPPESIILMDLPGQWGRRLRYTITAVDGRLWPIRDDRHWYAVHGVLPELLPPGQPGCAITTTVPVGGVGAERTRFLLESRHGGVCAKVSLAWLLQDALTGVVRVRFADAVVNPAGPPSLEVQRDQPVYDDNPATQRITVISENLRRIGSGPVPSPGPTADVAWATYEKACAERGIEPMPRPASP